MLQGLLQEKCLALGLHSLFCLTHLLVFQGRPSLYSGPYCALRCRLLRRRRRRRPHHHVHHAVHTGMCFIIICCLVWCRVPEECPPWVAELIESCMLEDPAARPTSKDIYAILLADGKKPS